MINIDIDDNPEELSWVLFRGNSQRNWETVNTWDGSTATAGTLDSTELSKLKKGWYRFVVRDAAANGVCCDFGRGFVSLMGPLASKDGQMGLVWGNNGQFSDEEEILFRINKNGYVSSIRWNEVQ